MKFGGLVGLTLVIAIGFITLLDVPGRMLAQQAPRPMLTTGPAPVKAAQPAVDLGNAFAAASETVRPSVVFIQAEQLAGSRTPTEQAHPQLPAPFDRFFEDAPNQIQRMPRRGQGSGFILTPDGYILTNNHVVDDFDRLTVQLFDRRKFSATVVGRDPNTDVAVIKIDADHLPAVTLGDSDSLKVGEWVLAIGNPMGAQFSFTVTAGIVSGRGRGLNALVGDNQWAIQDFIQTDAAINPGNSGGPLVNINGQVVGINSAIASQTGFYEGYSFAIPMNLARTIADQLIGTGRVQRAALGIRVAAVTPEDADYVGLDEVRGVTVKGFTDDSPAEAVGMEIGDVIVQIGDTPIDYVAQLQQLVGFKRPGERVAVTVMRTGGERKTFNVRLQEAQADERTRVASADRSDRGRRGSAENMLGLSFEEMSQQAAAGDARVGAENRGLVITDVDVDGPSRDKQFIPAGMRDGYMDVLTHVNGHRVQTLAQLRQALGDVKPGDVVSLRLLRVRGESVDTDVVRVRTGGE
jgi:serine protease Do